MTGITALRPKLTPTGTEPTNGSVPPRHHRSATATTTAYPWTVCFPTLPQFSTPHPFTPHPHGVPIDPDPNFAPTTSPWQPFQWDSQNRPQGPDPEPPAWGSGRHSRSPSPTSSDSLPDKDLHLQSYAQTTSSFKGGTTVNAIASVCDPLHPRNPLATRELTVDTPRHCLQCAADHRTPVHWRRPNTIQRGRID
jgi:hypothetical protein